MYSPLLSAISGNVALYQEPLSSILGLRVNFFLSRFIFGWSLKGLPKQ